MPSEEVTIQGLVQYVEEGWQQVYRPDCTTDPLYEEWHKRVAVAADLFPRRDGKLARPYQLKYAALAAYRSRILLAHEQGLGKTYEAILAILAVYMPHFSKAGGVLITAPNHTLNRVWKNEFELLGLGALVRVIREPMDYRMATEPIWIMNHDYPKLDPRVLQAKPSMLVIDEAHYMRPDTIRTAHLSQLSRQSKRVVALTGTPMDGWPEHLGCILAAVAGENSALFPYTLKDFTKRFTATRIFTHGFDGSVKPTRRRVAALNPSLFHEFRAVTAPLVHRLTIRDQEVLDQVAFPPVHYHKHNIQAPSTYLKWYEEHAKKLREELRRSVEDVDQGKDPTGSRKNVLTKLAEMRTATVSPWKLGHFDYFRLTAIVDLVRQYVPDRKFIIFVNSVDLGKMLWKHLSVAGINIVRVFAKDNEGKMDLDEREQALEQFLEDPNTHGLVANMALVSDGLTLTAASVVVHADPSWKGNKYTQANSRVIRPSQPWPHVDVWDIIIEGTTDTYIHPIMMRKVRSTREAVDSVYVAHDTQDEVEIARLLLNS